MSTVSLKQTEFGVQGTTSLMGVLKLFLIVTLVATSAVAVVWSYLSVRNWMAAAPQREYVRDAESLLTALQQYRARTGAFPSGGNAEVTKALTGKNTQLLAIVPTRLKQNEKGEFVDAWGTPLRIYIAGNDVLVRSAGPNLIFDDVRAAEHDDVILSN